MKAHLLDLAAHLAWADAVAFHAVAKVPAALEASDVLERLDHAATVGLFFGQLLRAEPLGPPPEGAPAFEVIRAKAKAAAEGLYAWVEGASEADLARQLTVPWFPDPPCVVTAAQALTQALMHAQHHRGQTMTRLKQLGGRSVNVDYIVWLWKGRPEPRWEA